MLMSIPRSARPARYASTCLWTECLRAAHLLTSNCFWISSTNAHSLDGYRGPCEE